MGLEAGPGGRMAKGPAPNKLCVLLPRVHTLNAILTTRQGASFQSRTDTALLVSYTVLPSLR